MLNKMIKAAEQGNATAQFILGLFYYKGRGVSIDMVEAVKWFRLAAEQEYSEAQFSLGVCYEKGEGVAVDLIEAYKWFLLAGASEKKRFDDMRSSLTKRMAAEHIIEAEARAKKWQEDKKKPLEKPTPP